ncbi:hypothetical protein BU16DRAFT_560629 [Lophium mytilinum]|uniref:Uncharacterized protein n=1 Tax=Lophium mytilinum TaxID=390894 RepID=A0A6A6QUA0_9PEZI|nr:hypothetical protein BU16DRAFT_560629 [Lophium mytilinum]
MPRPPIEFGKPTAIANNPPIEPDVSNPYPAKIFLHSGACAVTSHYDACMETMFPNGPAPSIPNRVYTWEPPYIPYSPHAPWDPKLLRLHQWYGDIVHLYVCKDEPMKDMMHRNAIFIVGLREVRRAICHKNAKRGWEVVAHLEAFAEKGLLRIPDV